MGPDSIFHGPNTIHTIWPRRAARPTAPRSWNMASHEESGQESGGGPTADARDAVDRVRVPPAVPGPGVLYRGTDDGSKMPIQRRRSVTGADRLIPRDIHGIL